ncbi:MAG TPA: EamA family transporter [bacterium]
MKKPNLPSADAAHARGILQISLAAALWGSLGVAGRFAFDAGLTPLAVAFYRATIAFVVVAAATSLTDPTRLRIRRGDVLLFGLFGLISIAIFFYVYLFAISKTTVATAAILLYTAPAWVLILSRPIFGEPLTPPKLAAVALAFAGCVLVVRGYDFAALRPTLPGTLAGLASGFTYALYSIFGKTALRRYPPQTTLTYALGIGSVFLGAMTYATGQFDAAALRAGWPMVVYLGLVTTLLAQFLYLSGLREVEAGRASLVATLEPVVAAVLGYVLLRERLDLLQAIGGAAVLSGIVVVRRLPVPPAELPPAG